MKIKKISLIYFSPVFHTRQLARIMGTQIGMQLNLPAPEEIDITIADGKSHVFSEEDLVILAIPVYGGRVPALAITHMGNIAADKTPAIILASYGNRAFEDALLELSEFAGKSGFCVIAGAACVAQHTIVPQCAAGRPDESDRQEIADFAKSIAALLGNNLGNVLHGPVFPGHFPYRNYAPVPLPQYVDDNCVHCGTCARECPADAIDGENVRAVDKRLCICCMRCINICPVQARHPDAGFIQAVAEKIVPLCEKRKENSFFLPSA